MKLNCIVLVLMISKMAIASPVFTRIKLDTVPDIYRPTDTSMKEPVYMQDFRFEVNQETIRARIVVDYTYPDQMIFGRDDDEGGPQPTIIQIPGLKYLPKAQTVVYEANGKQTVCARVEERRGLFGRHLHIRKTGLCTVTSEHAKHAEDDGWEIKRFTAIDTYFEGR